MTRPRVDDRDPVAEQLRFVEMMRGQQDRVAVLLHPQDVVVQLAPGLRIEPGRRLVEQHDLGLVHEREGQREPLTLAAGQRVEWRVRLVGELEALEQRRRRCAGARRTRR